MALWHYLPNFQKDSTKNEVSKHFKSYPTLSKKLVTSRQKVGGKDGRTLSFATNYKCQATHHLNAEVISFAIG